MPNAANKSSLTIELPLSKSVANRLLMMEAVERLMVSSGAGMASQPGNQSLAEPLPSDLENLPDDVRILWNALANPRATMQVGNAGTAMRFLTALFPFVPGQWTLCGNERMNSRPIGPLVEALRRLGARIEYLGEEGFPPLLIHGQAPNEGLMPPAVSQSVPQALEIELDASQSSQFASALMLVAPLLQKELLLRLKGTVRSASYLNLTAELMRSHGVEVQVDDSPAASVRVFPGHYRRAIRSGLSVENRLPEMFGSVVEADWSAAAFWMEMMAVCPLPGLLLKGLSPQSPQGEKAALDCFRRLGLKADFNSEGLMLSANANVDSSMRENMSSLPDAVPALAVACALQGIPFRFGGVGHLRWKESDRLEALCFEMSRLGISFRMESDAHGQVDSLVYDGSTQLSSDRLWSVFDAAETAGPFFETFGDHRMAMALAGVLLKDAVRLLPLLARPDWPALFFDHPEAVEKSYPAFWRDFEAYAYLCTLKH